MYKLTEQDRTPEGLKNLLKNYFFRATFMGGIIPGKRADGSTVTYKAENFEVEGVNSTEDLENLLRSDVYGAPNGISLEPRQIKKRAAVIFQIFSEDEQVKLKESNLPEEAIDLMKSTCFEIAEKYSGLGAEGKKKESEEDDKGEGVVNQEEYDKYFKQYDELQRPEIAELISSEDFAGKLTTNPLFTAKAVLIRFYILHKHKVKPELTTD